MAMQTSELEVVDYNAGRQSRVKIPRQHFLHRLRLKVATGALSGGTSGAFVSGAANLMIQNLQLKLGGQLVPRNLSFEDLRKLNLLTYKDQYPADGVAYLDLGRLPTHALRNVELIIQWAAVADLNDGDRTTITGASVTITRLEELNEGQSVGAVPLVMHKSITQSAAATTAPEPFDLQSGNVLQAVLIMPMDGNGDADDTLIETVSVIQDGVKYHVAAEPWDLLQEDNRADFELDAAPSGWAVVNFDRFGDGSQALRTADMNTLQLRFETTSVAGATIRIVPIEVALPSQ